MQDKTWSWSFWRWACQGQAVIYSIRQVGPEGLWSPAQFWVVASHCVLTGSWTHMVWVTGTCWPISKRGELGACPACFQRPMAAAFHLACKHQQVFPVEAPLRREMCFCFLSYGQKERQQHDVRAYSSSALPKCSFNTMLTGQGQGFQGPAHLRSGFQEVLWFQEVLPHRTPILSGTAHKTRLGKGWTVLHEAPRVASRDEGHHAVSTHSTPALPHSNSSGPGLLRTVTNTLKKKSPANESFLQVKAAARRKRGHQISFPMLQKTIVSR